MSSTENFILQDLGKAIGPAVAADIVHTYSRLVSKFRKGDPEGCLVSAGKFVEHTLRAIEGLRTGSVPAEIRSPAATIREIEKDTSLAEPIRLLVPRVAYAMIYEVRSKRGAVHVKGIDPTAMDASLAVHAASWVISEMLRLYHSVDEGIVAAAISSLSRGQVPFVEAFGEESVVTRRVPCDIELLLLLSSAEPEGLSRRALGISSKSGAVAVTRAVQKLEDERFIHKTADGQFHMTGPGEAYMANAVALENQAQPSQTRRKPTRRKRHR